MADAKHLIGKLATVGANPNAITIFKGCKDIAGRSVHRMKDSYRI